MAAKRTQYMNIKDCFVAVKDTGKQVIITFNGTGKNGGISISKITIDDYQIPDIIRQLAFVSKTRLKTAENLRLAIENAVKNQF
jgi:hypothetical protein